MGKDSWCHFHFQVPLGTSLSHTSERRTFFLKYLSQMLLRDSRTLAPGCSSTRKIKIKLLHTHPRPFFGTQFKPKPCLPSPSLGTGPGQQERTRGTGWAHNTAALHAPSQPQSNPTSLNNALTLAGMQFSTRICPHTEQEACTNCLCPMTGSTAHRSATTPAHNTRLMFAK